MSNDGHDTEPTEAANYYGELVIKLRSSDPGTEQGKLQHEAALGIMKLHSMARDYFKRWTQRRNSMGALRWGLWELSRGRWTDRKIEEIGEALVHSGIGAPAIRPEDIKRAIENLRSTLPVAEAAYAAIPEGLRGRIWNGDHGSVP